MSVGNERPQVRTAQELERKYALLLGNTEAIKQTEVGLVKVNNILNSFISATIGDLETLQAQLDGQIDTWYGSDEPTLLNEPSVNWQVSEYPDHVGDIYYDRETGTTFQFIEENGTYLWDEINSSLMSEIFGMANAAQDTADNKRRVFFTTNDVDTPTPPYDTGDIWIKNVGGTTGEMYICQIARIDGESYVSGDFVISTKYTDNTVALSAQEAAAQAMQKALDVYTDGTLLDLNFSKRLILNDDQVADELKSKIRFEDGSILFSAGNSTIQLKIDNDSIDFLNVTDPSNPILLASWSATNNQATSTELKLGNFAFIPRDNGSLDFKKVA